ncbi:MAG: alpha/beta hydrolase [Rhizobiales bacterium]|nr:alpha/beta hydrolase [Hyphomicrobiales bacterium]
MTPSTTPPATGLFLGRIPYVRLGSGPRRIVVVNGGQGFVRRFSAGSAARDIRQIMPLLPPDSTVVVLGYDADPPAGYDMARIVGDVATIMRTEIGPSTVMGISFGGFVAARLAAEHPDLVDRLILLITAHRFSAEGRARVAGLIDDLERGDLYGMARKFATLSRRAWVNLTVRLVLWLARNKLAAKLNPPATIIRSLSAALNEDVAQGPGWLAAIRAPTLILGGDADQFFDVAAMRETATAIPAAKLELIAGETHMLPLERPKPVAAAITRFLTNS